MSREVMQQALEAWQTSAYGTVQHHKAMLVAMTEVGKAALAQPVQPATDMSYTIALQRAIEWHCDGKAVPLSAAESCPYHAEKLNQALARSEHPEQMARLGWQYVECPACGSEGARAFPKPAQEPVAKVVSSGEYDFPMLQWLSANHSLDTAIGSLLYASPPQRQPLTDGQLPPIPSAYRDGVYLGYSQSDFKNYARAIEAAHGIKSA